MKAILSPTTQRALRSRVLSAADLGRLLSCTEKHAQDLLDEYVFPTAREHAIMRLCANVSRGRLGSILDGMAHDYEWRRIPGFERYEVSERGQVRRAQAGHGSMAGHVLRPKQTGFGHLYVKVAAEGRAAQTIGVHRAVCLAFNGPRPSPDHIVCHRNDVPDDNRPGNLYWGTPADNTRDRIRKAPFKKTDTKLTHRQIAEPDFTPRQIRKRQKAAMTYRLARLQYDDGR